MCKFKDIVSYCLFLILLNSCNGQSNIDTCKLSYKNARNNLNNYYKNTDQSLILKALQEVNQSLQCQDTRHKAIDLKISLLAILKMYKNGYQFIDSLNENDFSAKYKKTMNHNYFLALEYEEKSDTANRNKLLNETVANIQNYIRQENMPQGKLDEEAYYDLFFVKKKVMSLEKINAEIDLLKKQYPRDEEFFDALKSSMDEETKVVNPFEPPQ